MPRRQRRLRPQQRRTRPARASSVAERIKAAFGLPLSFASRTQARLRRILLALTVALATGQVCAEAADKPGALSDFILNLVRYTAWPPNPARRSVTVCYAHGGLLPPASLAVDNAVMIRGLPVAWKVVTAPAQLAGCTAVWLNADVRPAPREWLAAIGDQPVLTISNYAEFTADGGVIGAYRSGDDWRFEINLEALQRSRLNIAAAALRLSQRPKASLPAGETR